MSGPLERGLAAALAAVVLAGAIAGCGDDDKGKSPQKSTPESRVDVIKGLGPGSRFDPEEIYRREAGGVVTVISEFRGGGGLLGEGPGDGERGLGSGFVISGGGEIATNAHVVTIGEGRRITRAQHVYVQFQDHNQVPAKIVGADPYSDVALLKVDTAGLTLRPLPLGSSSQLRVGSPVAVIGSPFGEPESLSVGVISGTDRNIDSLTNFQISGAIQTDAAINRGNSGGPLVDGRGRVIGISSQIHSSTGQSSGVGFAVPIDTVKRSIAQLRDRGRASYAYVGVSSVAVFPQLAARLKLSVDHGVYVQEVTSGGPAAAAGLRGGTRTMRFQGRGYLVGGDVIAKAAGETLEQDSDLAEVISKHRPGERIAFEIYRGGERRTVDVKLGERPPTTPLQQSP